MLKIVEENDKIYSPIRKKWLVKKPEEVVRQNFVLQLVNDYGYSLEQMLEEENLTGRGSAQARADIVIYRHFNDIKLNNNPLIVVECKAENIIISEKDYLQGELYARIHNAPFFVTHNNLETKFWRVKKDKSPGYREEIENIPTARANDKEIEELFSKLKVFRQGEFRDILKSCHTIIRNNEKLDPTIAFDEIAKILFMKVYAERNLKAEKSQNIFSLDWVEKAEVYTKNFIAKTFDDTKTEFGRSAIFKPDEKINLNNTTIKAIIQKLEKYNLSETSVDTKGIAFESFLSDTFLRGKLGQFFTPRPVVEFMVEMINPQENQIVCDPACGSGGFLIKFFQDVQQKIYQSLNDEYLKLKTEIENNNSFSEQEKDAKILELFTELEKNSDITNKNTRVFNLANNCIFGIDANERAARTAKMNMIMHGDGHGGIHHGDGFLNINGAITDNKFDVVLTNPPFGMKTTDKDILKLFQLPKSNSITTQVLFLERSINLLKEKGKLAIVLPNGLFNNPKEEFVREFTENNGYILATVSLPRETFLSSDADVNCSLLFFQKFTKEEETNWQNLLKIKQEFVYNSQQTERQELKVILETKITQKEYHSKEEFKQASDDLKTQKKNAEKRIKELDLLVLQESRKLAKADFNYQIFMYEAEKVGITATGDDCENELIEVAKVYKQFLNNETGKLEKSAIVEYKDLTRWDAKNYLYTLTSVYELKKLKNYIYEHSEKVKLFDFPDEEFNILGVTNREGVYLNLTEKGETFNQPYKKVKAGELVYNPYRVNVGSIGIVDEEFDSMYISPAYVVFGVKEGLLNEYLYLVLSSDWFNPFLRAATSGSVRQNLTYDLLCELEIPLPDLDKQREIVIEWINLKEQQRKLKETMFDFKNNLSETILK